MNGMTKALWQMAREAIEELGGSTTNVDLRRWVVERYPGTNPESLGAEVIACTVNHPSRIHYSKNRKPRQADGNYDFLYRPERGKLELYDPNRHGHWEIAEGDDGAPRVQAVAESRPEEEETARGNSFAAEDHLRDYLASHLEVIEPGLTLYTDGDTVGVEFKTDVGRIDILALDRNGNFLVIELKVGRSPDSAAGQILRYRNWVWHKLAPTKRVRGMIIATTISDSLRYSLADAGDIEMKEYSLEVSLRPIDGIGLGKE